jgi:Glycosyl hydrolase family 3 N terminal domain/Fibronectin type III-like domain
MVGGLTFFSPNINIFRDPRWGRGQETYGEDPFLTARLGVAFITGMQGDDPDHPIVTATAKHYAVHSGPEPLRHGFDAKASVHDVEDTYLPAFRAAVVEGKVKSVMCVYNAVNGVPGCASEYLLDFTRVHLKPGEEQTVRFTLSDRDLSHVSLDGMHLVRTGSYGISVGGGQPDTGAPVVAGTFDIKGERTLPR